MADSAFRVLVNGYSLTTAEILYRLPDHPSLLQSYVWQDYDIHPDFPRLKAFLDYWSRNIEGRLFKVRVAHTHLLRPAGISFTGTEIRVH